MDKDREAFRAWCKSYAYAVCTDRELGAWRAALAYARQEREGWKPISEKPARPMPVVYYSTTRDFGSEGPIYPEPAFAGQPYRDERCDLGYWDGKEWCWQGTGHAVWESAEDERDPDNPTHWCPLLEPPSPVTESGGCVFRDLNVSPPGKD